MNTCKSFMENVLFLTNRNWQSLGAYNSPKFKNVF